MKRLEQIYLMNVALYFKDYDDLHKFIQVNKKCFNAIDNLKINPQFSNYSSLESFLKHFYPDTIDLCNFLTKISFYDHDAVFIRNPNYIVDNNRKEIISLFNKVHTLSLFNDESVNNVEFLDLCVKHAVEFTNLQKICGEIDYLISFFRNYTNDGKERYVPMPKHIEIINNSDEVFDVNLQNVRNIEKLLSYLRINDEMNVKCLFNTHPSESIESRNLLQRLSKINYRYLTISHDPCQLMIDKIEYIQTFNVSGGYCTNEMNELIEKTYASKVLCGKEDSISINPYEELHEWIPPTCVTKLEISNIIYDSDEITEVLPENQLLRDNIQEEKVLLPIVMDHIKKVSVYDCVYFHLEHNFNTLRTLSIFYSGYVSVNKRKTEKPLEFPSLKELQLVYSSEITFNGDCPQLQLIGIHSSSEITIEGSFPSLSQLNIYQSNNIQLPYWSFEEKQVSIQSSNDLSFINDEKKPQNPLEYLGISLDEFNSLCSQMIKTPNMKIHADYKKIFRMNDFYCGTVTNRVQIHDNKLIKMKEMKSGYYFIFYSTKFVKEDDEYEYIEIQTSNGPKLLPPHIRYFELILKGHNYITIGLMNEEESKFENQPIGWGKGEIGLHSDDGRIFNENGYGEEYIKPFANENCIIGCGFNVDTSEVFFTKNGMKLEKSFYKRDFFSIIAGFTVSLWDNIEINIGQMEFAYDLEKEFN